MEGKAARSKRDSIKCVSGIFFTLEQGSLHIVQLILTYLIWKIIRHCQLLGPDEEESLGPVSYSIHQRMGKYTWERGWEQRREEERQKEFKILETSSDLAPRSFLTLPNPLFHFGWWVDYEFFITARAKYHCVLNPKVLFSSFPVVTLVYHHRFQPTSSGIFPKLTR